VSALVLERREQGDDTGVISTPGTTVLLTPPISEDYWTYRVRVADGQAIIGFPKFFTIGIGFAVEEDWNTNLPYTSDAFDIARHIWHNRGANIPDDVPSFDQIVQAIQLIQDAARKDAE